MKDLIKEVALEVAEKQFPQLPEEVLDFAEIFLAELSKRAESVALDDIYAAWHGAGVDIAGGNWKRFSGMLPKLFTFPPIHDIEALIAERTAEVDKWKSTAEQHKENYDILNGDLRMKNAELTAQRDAAINVLEYIRRCIPYGGFAQIHDGSDIAADIDATIANLNNKEK